MRLINCRTWILLGAVVMNDSAYAAFPSLDSDGNFNSGVGTLTLQFVSGSMNTASGDHALFSDTTGSFNTANGAGALQSNTTANNNTATGYSALFANTTGHDNVANGTGSLFSNTTGQKNVANGAGALDSNTTGSYNTANGFFALYSNTTGQQNVANGDGALYLNKTGSHNIALGSAAGKNLTIGSYNIVIGNPGVARETKVIRIGTQGTQLKAFIAGVRGVTISKGAEVLVNSSGQIGVQTSSRRYKQDIQPMGNASSALLKLEPVTFRYKEANEQGQKPVQFGLIAEDVAKVMPELVVYDEDGNPETVAYQTLSSLLLNELQKEHDKLVAVEAQSKVQAAELALVNSKADLQAAKLTSLYAQNAMRAEELAVLNTHLVLLEKITQQFLAAQPSSASFTQVAP